MTLGATPATSPRCSRVGSPVSASGRDQGSATARPRHFAGSQLVAAGVDVRTVSARLGHSPPSITLDIYTHRVQDNDRAAAELLGQLIKPKVSGDA